jgi:hypothetical protein
MKKIILILILCLFTFSIINHAFENVTRTAPKTFYFYDDLNEISKTTTLVHMMFFPWDKNQKLLEDDMDFDSAPYLRMVERAALESDTRVIMWTYEKTKAFCLKYYPEIWHALETYSDRPVMYIDILRWLVVYHFGGIYWQYDSVMLAPKIADYLPSGDKKVRFFTETRISADFAIQMADEPIRKGVPEELTRVATQVFSSAEPKNPMVREILDFFLQRLKTEKVLCDYDILYITGNAGISEFYDRFAKDDENVDLVPLDKVRDMIDFNSKGRWRLDHLAG